ncbi:MAG: GC-type dockerin domain-anchored protein [Phycisphaerales bacterium]
MMRTTTAAALAPALLVPIAGLTTAASAQDFVEGVNHTIPLETTWTATRGHEQAFLWTAQNDFDMIQMLWHTSAIADGVIRLRENDGGQPGAILREVSFSSTSTGWGGDVFGTPYTVTAGDQYFVTFSSLVADYRDFVAVDHPDAVQMTYFWQPFDSGSSWNGPFSGAPGRRPIMFYGGDLSCYADFDEDGDLTIFDFLAFQNAFDAGDLAADCDEDGDLTLFDFLCYQNAFDAGCE